MDGTSNLTLSIVETVAETVSTPLVVLNSKVLVRFANHAFYQAFRLSPEAIIGQSLYSISNARWDILDLRDLLKGIVEHGERFQDLEIEQDFPHIGNRVLLLSGRRIDGFPLILLGIEDITDLRERDLRLAAIVESSDDAILSQTLDGTIVSWNSGAQRIFGYAAQEMIGRPITTLASSSDDKQMSGIVDRIRRGEKVDHFETTCRDNSGQLVDVSVTVSPIVGRNGVITGASIVARDITELKSRQKADFSKHKLESLGRVADGITHNFNNLLGGILASAQLALMEADKSPTVADELRKITNATVRGAEIIRQLMLYSGHESLAFEAVDISLLIEEMVALLQALVSKRITFNINLGKNLPSVQAAPDQIRQLVMNLSANAAEAIGEREGTISVTTALVSIDSSSRKNVPQGDYVRLQIVDTGCGMTPEVGAKIFDPFFTTKEAGRGLGLSLIEGIVRVHRGAIDFQSAPGQGSTFEILLPCAGQGAGAHREITSGIQERIETPTVTILVVVNEELLRLSVANALRKFGCLVIEANDGLTAMNVIRQNERHVNVVLLDLTLPGLSCRKVVVETQRIRPDLKVVITSAYDKKTVDATLAGLRVEYFLRKPFLLEDLLGYLQEILGIRLLPTQQLVK